MTINTLKIELTCNGRTLAMGPGLDIDITKVSGLESSELEISTSDNALVDGVSVDGKKIGSSKVAAITRKTGLRSLSFLTLSIPGKP